MLLNPEAEAAIEERKQYVQAEVKAKRAVVFIIALLVSLVLIVFYQKQTMQQLANTPVVELVGLAICPSMVIAYLVLILWARGLSIRVNQQIDAGTYVPRAAPSERPTLFQYVVSLLSPLQWIVLLFAIIPTVVLIVRSLNINSNKETRIATMCDSIVVHVTGTSYTITDTNQDLGSRIVGMLLVNGTIKKYFDTEMPVDVGVPIQSIFFARAAFAALCRQTKKTAISSCTKHHRCFPG